MPTIIRMECEKIHSSCHMALLLVALMMTSGVFASCAESGLQLQILGSGGPGDSDGRASSAYLLWRDGRSRVLVDAGSSVKDHFFAADAVLSDLQVIALSHLHPDHSAGLTALLWPQNGTFAIAGPAAGDGFPDIQTFINRQFGPEGAYPVFVNRINFDVRIADPGPTEPIEVWREEGLVLSALAVPHANVPTLGYRFDLGESSIAFASDQNGTNPAFIEFVQGVDVLVIHLAVPEAVNPALVQLHAIPSVWGAMASAAQVGRVVVSHYPPAPDAALAILQDNYAGPVVLGEDMMCIALNH